ncbi:hypothetical protein KSF_060350 [Reticulibacter mediterranei]|uniref:Cyanobacterial TRADD-N associated 2 transmembrane domain-containing protein n=1 Tax=Reticulibacter mediterranei TaxID=2778369 RepID=A0A8J3N6E2_9CHLR|nr:hypothetical protein [Reticulibacter mediterranei]GHO95987.1 hypothetical protein KSF_060350 [Reticulibacter mediterranei]
MAEIELLIPIITAIAAGLSSISALIKYIRDTSKRNQVVERQEDIIASEAEKKPHEEAQLDVMQSIESQLTKLAMFYSLNKDQAKLSFHASMSVIIIGSLTIASGIWLFYLRSSDITLPAITIISGVLCDFIGASYFFMYRMNLTQMNYYFRQLVVLQDTMLTIKLVKELPDEKDPHDAKKITLTEKIVVTLLERGSNLTSATLIPLYEVNAAKNHTSLDKTTRYRSSRELNTTE